MKDNSVKDKLKEIGRLFRAELSLSTRNKKEKEFYDQYYKDFPRGLKTSKQGEEYYQAVRTALFNPTAENIKLLQDSAAKAKKVYPALGLGTAMENLVNQELYQKIVELELKLKELEVSNPLHKGATKVYDAIIKLASNPDNDFNKLTTYVKTVNNALDNPSEENIDSLRKHAKEATSIGWKALGVAMMALGGLLIVAGAVAGYVGIIPGLLLFGVGYRFFKHGQHRKELSEGMESLAENINCPPKGSIN
jgi:hypothetical protein